MLSAAALLVVGVRLVPVVFKMDISVSEDYLFLTGRETALICCGFLAFVRWDLMSRGWLGLLTQDVRTRLGVCSCTQTWTPATSSRPSGCCV